MLNAYRIMFGIYFFSSARHAKHRLSDATNKYCLVHEHNVELVY